MCFLVFVLVTSWAAITMAADASLVAWWDFDQEISESTVEVAGGVVDT